MKTLSRPFPISNLPLWRTGWRAIQRRPFQSVLFILGVALGVAMMVSIDLANGSASRAFALSADAVAGKTTHRIVGGPAGLDEAFYRRLRVEGGFSPAAPLVEGYVNVPELEGETLRLVGIDPFAEPPFRNYLGKNQAGAAGDVVPLLAQANTILLPSTLAERYGIQPGGTLTLDTGGRSVPVLVVGLLAAADDVSRSALATLLFTDIATAQEILGMIGRLSHIDVIAGDEDLPRLEGILPEGARLEPASTRSNALQQMTAAFELNLTALSLLALIVGMFLIYNTATFSVVQRRRLFGILRCLGVTGGQLFGLIVAEAVLLSLIGSLLGLAIGVLLGRGMVRLVTQTINDLYFVLNVQQVTVPSLTLVKGLVLGVLAAIVASLPPALEAMRTAPQSTLRRSTLERSARRLLPWLSLAGLLLAAAGGFLLWLPNAGLAMAFTGLFAVLIAFAFLTPAATVGLMRLLMPVSSRLMGVLGRMAPRDIVRSLSRTSVATAALMLAVAVIVGISIMIGSFRQTVAQWLNNTLQADVYVSPPSLTNSQTSGTLAAEVVETAVKWPGVVSAVTVRQARVLAPDLGRPVEVAAVSGDVSQGNRSYLWTAGSQAEIWRGLAAGEGVFLSEPLVRQEKLAIPPGPITLMTESGPHRFPVLAVFYDYASDQGVVMIGRDAFVRYWGDEAVSTIGLFLQPGADAAAFANDLKQAFSGRQNVVVQSNRSVRAAALEIFDRTFAITAALQLLATLVAFIGVLSALMSLQLERARELGILRAAGMTVSQLWRLTLLETGLMGGTAGLLAMPAGWVLAWILIYVINLRSFGWSLEMALRPGYFLQAFAVALIAALLAGIYPASRLGQMVIATAIRQE